MGRWIDIGNPGGSRRVAWRSSRRKKEFLERPEEIFDTEQKNSGCLKGGRTGRPRQKNSVPLSKDVKGGSWGGSGRGRVETSRK